jgi:hypothetical protein
MTALAGGGAPSLNQMPISTSSSQSHLRGTNRAVHPHRFEPGSSASSAQLRRLGRFRGGNVGSAAEAVNGQFDVRRGDLHFVGLIVTSVRESWEFSSMTGRSAVLLNCDS